MRAAAQEEFAIPAFQPEFVVVDDNDGLEHIFWRGRGTWRSVYSGFKSSGDAAVVGALRRLVPLAKLVCSTWTPL